MREAVDGSAGAMAERVLFVGVRKDFSKIVGRGVGLELLTAGFYRFWLATKMRRHLWSHTVIAGNPLEYTGTGRELLIGFFFALAILTPFYLVYFGAGLLAESLAPFASIPLIIAFYFLSQFAAFRARRYRVTRTVWRGVRFGMGGASFGYVWRASLWAVVVVLTLGLAWPWREAALERYKMRFTRYGSLQGAFVGTGGGLFKKVWWLWLLAPFTLTVIVFMPSWLAALNARRWRWQVAGMRFGSVSFTSDLQSKAIAGRYWALIGWSLLTLVVFLAVGAGNAYALSRLLGIPSVKAFFAHPAAIGVLIGVYLPAILLYNYLHRMILVHDIWERLARSIEIFGLQEAEAAETDKNIPSAMGESLGDSFDVGAF